MTEAEYFQTEEGRMMEFIGLCEGQQRLSFALNHLTSLYRLRDEQLMFEILAIGADRNYGNPFYYSLVNMQGRP